GSTSRSAGSRRRPPPARSQSPGSANTPGTTPPTSGRGSPPTRRPPAPRCRRYAWSRPPLARGACRDPSPVVEALRRSSTERPEGAEATEATEAPSATEATEGEVMTHPVGGAGTDPSGPAGPRPGRELVTTFHYGDRPVRTVVVDGEPWFVIADVCRVLDLSNPTMAANRLDPDDLSTAEVIDGMGRTQQARIPNEAGLYELIFQSRKPEARDFRRWVTHEVLPAIRKTGRYEAQPAYRLPQSYSEALRELADQVER